MRKYLLLLLSLVGLSAAAGVRQTTTAPEIYGSMIYATGWSSLEDAPYGIYSIIAKKDAPFTLHRRGVEYCANGGGTYVDGKYYMVGYTTSIEGAVMNITYSVYDTENNWKLLRSVPQDAIESIPTDYAFDPTTGRIYGCFYHSDGNFRFGILNRLTGEPEELAVLDEQLVALAANSNGEIYAIGISGMLYRVTVKGREVSLSEIASTGQTVRFAQSACFDTRNDKLYWALSFYDTSKEDGIYEVDTKTGAVSQMVEYTNGYSFTGIYTLAPYAKNGAPAKVKDFALAYPKGATSGNINFTLPSTTVDGKPLTGELTYHLLIDDKTELSGKGQAGSEVSVSHAFTSAALHSFTLSAANATGRGQTTTEFAFVGNDTPSATNVTMSKATNGFTITWEAPKSGDNGGYIDASTLRYKVMRMPGEEDVYEGTATTFTDVREITELDYYWYAVSASASGVEGKPVESNKMKVGEACSAPYFEDFNHFEDYLLYNILDENKDENTWNHGYGALIYPYSDKHDADDWAITPPLRLDPEYVYILYFNTHTGEEGYTEQLSVSAGNAPTVAAMTETILPAFDIDWSRNSEKVGFIKPQAEGYTYVGFHASSPKSQDLLYLDEIGIEAFTSIHAPDTVTNFTVTPGEKGALKATITFTLPKKTMHGDALTDITSVEIYRNGAPLTTFSEGLLPGAVITHTDNAAKNGFATYHVIVYNGKGQGLETGRRVYIGEDFPNAVRNFKASEQGNGKVLLTWEAPLTGQNGGYIDPTTLTYHLTNVGGMFGKSITVTGTSYTDQITVSTDEQKLQWYEIAAESPRGTSPAVQSRSISLGTPYAMPYAESFPGKNPARGPWETWTDSESEWRYAGYGTADPQDNDGGEMLFLPDMTGTKGELVSPKIALKDIANPILSFWLWHNERVKNMLTVKLRAADGNEYTLAEYDQSIVEDKDTTAAWTLHRVSIKEHLKKAGDYVQFVFEVRNISFDAFGLNVLYLDNILFRNYLDHDLEAGELSGATSVTVGETLHLTLAVTNMGVNDADDYTVELYRDNTLVDTKQGTPIKAYESALFTFSDRPNADASEVSRYKAVIKYEADQMTANNTSAEKDVNILPGLPFINTLKGTEQGNQLFLTWTEPYADSGNSAGEVTTEDFESYTPFTTKNMGLWTLYDGDGAETGGIIDYNTYNYYQYENAETPMAYMVFNPYKLSGIDNTFAPHSGEQVLAAFVSIGKQNDDWLISPEVDGAQTISFWAKAPDCQWFETRETIEVLYSTDVMDIPYFKLLKTITVSTEQWKEHKIDLPEGTKYFAIRTVSRDQFVLYIDDITYRPVQKNLTLQGYNVYCNDTKLNAALLTSTSFIVNNPTDGDRYEVTAVYAQGESARSNSYVVGGATGIFDAAVQPSVEAVGGRGHIAITAPEGQHVNVYTTAGRLCRSVSGSATVNVPRGVYIVRSEGTAVKVLVQ